MFIIVTVVDKFVFNNINEIWENKKIVNKNVLNYNKEQLQESFYNIFGKNKVINSKIVGIKFSLEKINLNEL